MLSEEKKLFVNWQDGMKIRSEHFVGLENAFNEGLRNSVSMMFNPYNYGLLPSDSGDAAGVKLQCALIGPNRLKVILENCRAVTEGGVWIERKEAQRLLPGVEPITWEERIDSQQTQRLDVVISVDLFERVAVGVPDPEETPPRRPFVMPEYTLKVQPSGTPIHSIKELKVGEVNIADGAASVVEDYIPPCTRLSCSPALIQRHQHFAKQLQEIMSNSLELYQKLRSGYTPEGVQEETLHDSLELFVEKVVFFLANYIEWYKKLLPHSSPLFFVEFFVLFARMIHTILACIEHEVREDLLKYFYWGPYIEPGRFEEVLGETLAIEYAHSDIRGAVQQIQTFMELVGKLFEKLPHRKFENYQASIILNKRIRK